MAGADTPARIELRLVADYRFEVSFENPAMPVLITDEPPPLGGDAGPSPERMLATAVANCLASSLLFAMRKFKNRPGPMRGSASVRTGRNAEQRLRIVGIDVELRLAEAGAEVAMLPRILEQFEAFCVVTQSVRDAFPVQVRVLDRDGAVLKED